MLISTIMKLNFIICIILLSSYSFSSSNNLSSHSNLLKKKNFNLNGSRGYSGIGSHKYVKNQSHTNDGSGCIKLVKHWYTQQLKTPSFKLKKGQQYTIGAYMKAIGSKYGQNIMLKVSGASEMSEMIWNVSTSNQWEEILLPYKAKKTGLYHISIFTYKYSLSLNGKYVNQKGTNLDKSATIYVDDFFVYESKKILSNEETSSKKPFDSDLVKIDTLGNWSIYTKGKWKDIFPKFAYQDWGIKDFKTYKEYGFTGIINIDTIKKLHNAIDSGLLYNGIQINNFTSKNKKLIKDIKIFKKNLSSSIILYNFDNEGSNLSNMKQVLNELSWIKQYDKSRPIYILNGVAEGITRQYNNSIDVTGTYITETGNEIETYENPINSFELINKTDNQKVPVSMMQLQCYYHNLFVPSIFKGLGEGAKALTFWRGGKGLDQYNCPKDFTKNVWASSLKGDHGIFKLIDKLLPILREPLETRWSASVDLRSTVSIASRDHDSKHYLILANFANKAQKVKITLNNLSVLEVENFFTKKALYFTKKSKEFFIDIDKYNNGYLILELKSNNKKIF